MKTEVKKLERSQVEIDFELDEQEFTEYLEKALGHLKSHVTMDGFRKGNVPDALVEKKVGTEGLLMEAGDLAVKEGYAKFVAEHAMKPIGDLEVQILKIAKGSPFLFKVKVAVLPEIALPDYRTIAARFRLREFSVDNKEIQDALHYLQKSRAKFSKKEGGAREKDFVEIEYQNEHINYGKTVKDHFVLGEGGFMKDFESHVAGMKAGDEKEFSAKFPENTPNQELAGKKFGFKVSMKSVQTMELPEINDAFAKELGAFEGLDSFKKSLKEGIAMEKAEAERQRRRGEILDAIVGQASCQVPETMVEYESKRLFEDFKSEISQNSKVSFEEYLKSIKKTEEEIRKSFTLEAEKRLKNFLILQEIGKKENVEVSAEELQDKVNRELKKHPKESLAKIDTDRVREYTRSAICNEKVFQLLEKLSQNT